jgi:hypothetical protein
MPSEWIQYQRPRVDQDTVGLPKREQGTNPPSFAPLARDLNRELQ